MHGMRAINRTVSLVNCTVKDVEAYLPYTLPVFVNPNRA